MELKKVHRNIALLKKCLKLLRTLNLMEIIKTCNKSHKCKNKQTKKQTNKQKKKQSYRSKLKIVISKFVWLDKIDKQYWVIEGLFHYFLACDTAVNNWQCRHS